MDERERRARVNARRVLAGGTRSLSKEGNRQRFRNWIEGEHTDRLIHGAREGDKECIEVLRDRGRDLRSLGLGIPPDLLHLAWDVFLDGDPKGRSGPKPYDKQTRDEIIAGMVRVLVEDYGFLATRGEGAKQNETTVSACLIVAEELPEGHRLSEDAVEAIWKASKSKRDMDEKRRKEQQPP